MELSSLDLSVSAEQGFEFEFVPEGSGVGSGLFFTVIGRHSDTVKDWTRKEVNKMRQREAFLIKKGKGDEFRQVEEDEEFSIKSAAIRIIDFKGLTEGGKELPFSKETALTLCRINQDIRDQVIAASDSLTNFTKSK